MRTSFPAVLFNSTVPDGSRETATLGHTSVGSSVISHCTHTTTRTTSQRAPIFVDMSRTAAKRPKLVTTLLLYILYAKDRARHSRAKRNTLCFRRSNMINILNTGSLVVNARSSIVSSNLVPSRGRVWYRPGAADAMHRRQRCARSCVTCRGLV